MKPPILVGDGIAPDVTIVDGTIYVAYGASTNTLMLVRYTLDGVELGREVLSGGFDQSFPRFSGSWLVYRMNETYSYRAVAYHVLTGQRWVFFGPAAGTYSLTVNADLGLAAYEWQRPGEPWRIWFGSLTTGQTWETGIEGAPDGLDQILSMNQVTLRKDTRGDVPGIWSPVTAGDLTVGMLRDEPSRPNGGIGVQLPGDVLRVLLEAQNCPDPRCATDGTVYAIVCWNPVRLMLATMAELRALPPVVTPPIEPPIKPPDHPPDKPEKPEEPEKPPIKPPKPPRPYRHHKEQSIMADTLIVLRGPGGRLGRPDEKNTGPWAAEQKGFRGFVWDGSDKSDARYHFVRPADRPKALISKQTGAVAGWDATSHSPRLDQQGYLKPDGDTSQGWAEEWQFYDGNANGAIEAQIEYAPGSGGDDGAFFSYPLAVEVIG